MLIYLKILTSLRTCRYIIFQRTSGLIYPFQDTFTIVTIKEVTSASQLTFINLIYVKITVFIM